MLRYWLCFTSLIYLARNCGANYCRDANLCCQGRDSSCVVQKAHQNAIIEDLTDKPCYCDHACLKLGDCCPDFRETCGVVDCVVSEWGAWSECDTSCGSGGMERARRVLRAAAHGGRHCPSLVQRRACQAHHGCAPDSDVPLREESAMILPGALSVSRRSNETGDIRKNLRLRNPDDPESNAHREYCVQFLVTKVSKGCHTDSEYKALREGNTVSVMCETAALRRDLSWRCGGHGVVSRPTRFYALLAPHCRGKWERANTSPDRHSEPCANPDFIFVYCVQFLVTKVSKGCHTDSEYKALREGNTVSVMCETAALRRDLSWRCGGHGVVSRPTRFYALLAPHCRGKWERANTSPDRHSEPCANPDFIFV